MPGTPKLRSLLKKTFESRLYDTSDRFRSGSAKRFRNKSNKILKSKIFKKYFYHILNMTIFAVSLISKN